MNTSLTTHAATPAPALRATHLSKHFSQRGRWWGTPSARTVRAVSDVSFELGHGETLGVVGESGCGKSTLARMLVRLHVPDSGDVAVAGELIDPARPESMRLLRQCVQMVFQDSYASLNPRLSVEQTVAFGPQVQGQSPARARALSHDMLQKVGLDPTRYAHRFTHELSGGQRQRVNIARALVNAPRVVVLDEPVSALDKSVEAQVINLLCDLRAQLDLSFVFISHDLNVVRYLAQRVMVMYLGKVVEVGPVEDLYARPAHPYTRALLASTLSGDPDRRTQTPPISGDPPSPMLPPSGCRFRTRCPFAEAVCAEREPELTPLGSRWHVGCHMAAGDSGHSRAGRIHD